MALKLLNNPKEKLKKLNSMKMQHAKKTKFNSARKLKK